MTYDANGNLTSISEPSGITTFTWDARNRLVALTDPTTTAAFGYDALGRRLSKTANGTTTQFLYDGLDIAQELDASGTSSYLRTLNIDEPISRNGTEFYLADTLGSVIALTDPAGLLTTSYTYDPFGRTTLAGTASLNPFQFTARENDALAGLYAYRARYYTPTFHRFISEDPSGLLAGLNFYTYVDNSAVNFTDPFGLDKDECGKGGGGTALDTAANVSAGFGDILTSGLGLSYLAGLPSLTEWIREQWRVTPGLPTSGAPDVVDPKCSWAYTVGQAAGIVDAAVIAGAGVARGVQPGGFLNANRYLRIGFGRHGGNRVFRVAGEWVERISGRPHIDLWRGGPL